MRLFNFSTNNGGSAKPIHKRADEVADNASVDDHVPSLRKIELPEEPNPKRRKKNKSLSVIDSPNNKPEQRDNLVDKQGGVRVDAEKIEDTEMSNQADVEEKKQIKDTSTDTTTAPLTTNLPDGTMNSRWHIDSAIAMLKNQLGDVPENCTTETETHEKEVEEQLRTKNQNRKRDRPTDNAVRELETDSSKKHSTDSIKDGNNKQKSQWCWLPDPSLQLVPYIDQTIRQNSPIDTPDDAKDSKPEPTKKHVPVPKGCSNNEQTGEDKDIEMNEARESSAAPLDKIEHSWTRLENWRKSIEQQLHCLKKELWEDSQLWRQEIARTTVHSTANCDFPTRNIHRNFHRC